MISLRKSVYFSSIGLTTLLILVICGVSVTSLVLREQTLEHEAIHKKGDLAIKVLSDALADPIWNFNPTRAQAILAMMKDDTDYYRAVAYNDKDAEFSKFQNFADEPSMAALPEDNLVHFNGDIKSPNDGSKIGRVVITYHTQRVENVLKEQAIKLSTASLAIVLVMLFCQILILRKIIRPLKSMTNVMGLLSSGKLDTDIPSLERQDEIGAMANSLSVFKENALETKRLRAEQEKSAIKAEEEKKRMLNELVESFNRRVGSAIDAVANEVEKLREGSINLKVMANETASITESVATASEMASKSVNNVASATEELSASINEITRNMAATTRISNECSASAQGSQQNLDSLSQAIDEISAVTYAINDIADQTNLLALNATIESARAGEAGKGFAVVANEVKALAGQTRNMTDEITGKVEIVKGASTKSIDMVMIIMNQIREVSAKADEVSSAIEEQNTATQEISRSIQSASAGTQEVNLNVARIQSATSRSSQSATEMNMAADNLAAQAHGLKEAVESFLKEIRQ